MCPASAPASGGTCPIQGLECEYGDNANSACDVIVICGTGGWQEQTSTGCPTGGTCPSSYSGVSQGAMCSPSGLDCGYSQGQCNCTVTAPVSLGTEWRCFTPATGCPAFRPDLGTACSTPSTLACNYGACQGGLEEECTDGYWKSVAVPCAL